MTAELDQMIIAFIEVARLAKVPLDLAQLQREVIE